MDIIGQAAWVAQLANIEYFKHILAAFQSAAVEEGFCFSEGTEIYVLSEKELEQFGRAVIRAKHQFLAPRAINAELERWADRAVEDGEAIQWVHSILSALQQRGIVLERVRQRVVDVDVTESLGARFAELYGGVDADAILLAESLVHKPS